jgi:hypothetical protein
MNDPDDPAERREKPPIDPELERIRNQIADLLAGNRANIAQREGVIQRPLWIPNKQGKGREKLLDYLEHHETWNPIEFMKAFMLPSDFVLKPGQETIIDSIASILGMKGGASFEHSIAFAAETGWGKGIAIHALAAFGLGIQFTKPSSPDVIGNRPVLPIPGDAENDLEDFAMSLSDGIQLIVTPTIALAVEFYSTIRRMYGNYYDIANANTDLFPRFKQILPPVRYVKRRNNTSSVCYPCKLVAGTSGSLNIFCDKPDDTTGAAPTGTAIYASTIVMTQELYERFTLIFNTPPRPFMTQPVKNFIGIVLIDEIHTVLVGRYAIRVALQRTKMIAKTVIGLTGTLPPSFTKRTGIKTIEIAERRRNPRILFPLPAFPQPSDAMQIAIDSSWLGYMQALTTAHEKRTAVFVENKYHLKVTLCVLVDMIQKRIKQFGLFASGEIPEILLGIYGELQTAITTDPVICRDVTKYGLVDGRQSGFTFREAYLWAALRGILLITADMGTYIRKIITTILTAPGIPWAIVLATSAIAEGTNMSQLRTVVVTSQERTDDRNLPFYKAGQMIGRGDREDVGGFAFGPMAKQLTTREQPVNQFLLHLWIASRPVALTEFVGLIITPENPTIQIRGYDCLKASDLTGIGIPQDRHEEIRAILKQECSVRGLEKIAYQGASGLRSAPMLIISPKNMQRPVDMIETCAYGQLIRLFAHEDTFNFGVLLIDNVVAGSIAQLPMLAQLCVISLALTITGGKTLAMRAPVVCQAYEVFIAQRIADMQRYPDFWALSQVIKRIISAILGTRAQNAAMMHDQGFQHEAPLVYCDNEPDGWGVFVVELLLATNHWSKISTTWAIYRGSLGSVWDHVFMLHEIFHRNKKLPVHDQTLLLMRYIEQRPDLNIKLVMPAEHFTLATAIYALGAYAPNRPCGMNLAPKPLIVNPFKMQRLMMKEALVDNLLLTLLTFTCSCLTIFYDVTDTKSLRMRYTAAHQDPLREDAPVVQVFEVDVPPVTPEEASATRVRYGLADWFHNVVTCGTLVQDRVNERLAGGSPHSTR